MPDKSSKSVIKFVRSALKKSKSRDSLASVSTNQSATVAPSTSVIHADKPSDEITKEAVDKMVRLVGNVIFLLPTPKSKILRRVCFRPCLFIYYLAKFHFAKYVVSLVSIFVCVFVCMLTLYRPQFWPKSFQIFLSDRYWLPDEVIKIWK